MHEAGIGSDDFRQMGQEGDDIMFGFALDLVNSVDVESRCSAFFPDGFCGFLRDHSQFGERVTGMGLDLEPDAEARFR